MTSVLVDSPFRSHAPGFAGVTGETPRLELVAETDAHEGPVYVADEHALYFTSVPHEIAPGFPETQVRRLSLSDGSVTTVIKRARMANGMALDRDGRLVICEQGTSCHRARLSRLDRETGEAEGVVDAWCGLRLNSPNDVVVKSDGSIWFTDPSYGHLQGFRPDPVLSDYVYRYEPWTATLSVVSASFDKPNGLAFSPDERTLYVADNGKPHQLVAFDVVDGHRLEHPRVVAQSAPGFPDGLKVDSEGRIYAAAPSGVQVLDPGGRLLGEIELPGAVNFTFGGPRNDVLYITADNAIWAAVLDAKGA